MPCQLPKVTRATQFVARCRWPALLRVLPRMNCFRAPQWGRQTPPVPVGMRPSAASLPQMVPRVPRLRDDLCHPLHRLLADSPPHRRDTRGEEVANQLSSVPAFRHLLVGDRPCRALEIPELDLQRRAEPTP